MFGLAIFRHVSGPVPDGVSFTGVPTIRRRDKQGAERIEMLAIRFTGATEEEVRAKADAQFSADRQRALKRDANLRAAAAQRAKQEARP